MRASTERFLETAEEKKVIKRELIWSFEGFQCAH